MLPELSQARHEFSFQCRVVLAGCYDRPKTIKLYDNPVSGHAHRVRLFLSLLDLPYESILVDMRAGEHKTPDYLQLSPLGQVPTLVDDGIVVSDSCAALVYLAKKYGDARWRRGRRRPRAALAVHSVR